MPNTKVESDLFTIVEEVDEIVSDAFRIANEGGIAEDPKRRHRLFIELLRGFGEYTPGFEQSQTQAELKRELGLAIWRRLEKDAGLLSQMFNKVVEPTSATTSYWSPIDERRHTVIHKSSDSDKAKTLGYAYAFFALTFAGAENGLFSVIQYIAVRAAHKRGPRVSFREELPDQPNSRWWHIPGSVHKSLLEDSGFKEEIERVILHNGRKSEAELKRLLNGVLINASDTGLERIDSFARPILQTFRERYEGLSDVARAVVEDTRLFLTKLFGSEPALTSEQAFFMLVTHLIYKEACPADYFYTFPTPVSTTCCVITIGTRNILSEPQQLALSRIASSLFTHPLLLDYDAQEAVARERYAAGAIHRIRGPLGALRHHIKELVKQCDDRNTISKADLKNVITHEFKESFETGLDRIHSTVRFLEGFIGATKPAEFEAVSLLSDIVAAQQTIHKHITCTFTSTFSQAWIWGWQSELEFCIEEMFYNGARVLRDSVAPAISLEIGASEELDAEEVELVRATPHKGIQSPGIKISIYDNGPGIASSMKEKIFRSGVKGKDSGSTGKGLYLVRHFIHERFHGLVYECGIQGVGATFALILPARRMID